MYQLVNPTLLQSIAFKLWQIYLPKIVRQCGQLSSSPPGSAAHLWWAMMIGWVIWLMKFSQNVSSKNEKLIFILCLTSDDWPSDPSNKIQPKCKKGPLSHEKMKCSFLDYVRILMISKAIQAMKVNQPTQNSQFHTIHNSSNLFSLKWPRMTQNGQFHMIYNFSNLFWLKWLRMTRNG